MRKSHLVLVLGLLAVMLISNLEDYLSSPEFSISGQTYDSIDYYMTDFSLSAITDTGKISHTMGGQYLAYWENKGSSFIIRPRLVSKDDGEPAAGQSTAQPVDAVTLTAEEAVLDHETQVAELTGKVNLLISNNGATQFELDTSQLSYQMNKKHISTDADVRITSPHIQLTGTGLDSQLDESTLRLNANVKSTYQPH